VKSYLPKKRWEQYLFKESEEWWRHLYLFPLAIISWVYRIGVWMRTTLYQRGFFKTRQLPCRVLSVGNIILGGTGKTPLVAALAKELQQRGMHVGILSRGYRGLKERTGGVLSDGEKIHLTPAEAGDEPFMLATIVPGVPVLVGKKRYEMGLHAYERFGINCLILDDGFQHLKITRDVDIVLIDTRRGFGNGHLFPRGPLREPLRSLCRASLLVLSKTDPSEPLDEIEGILGSYAPKVPLYHSRYKPVSLLEVASGKTFPPQFVREKRVFAFAGVADPEYFVHVLKGLGADIVRSVPFSDHHQYTPEDVRKICEYRDTVDLFVTTQKDYVKLHEIPLDDLPLFVLAIEQEILEQAFYQSVFSLLSP
jgi:tetraacyldisaccharide 4'-kinase